MTNKEPANDTTIASEIMHQKKALKQKYPGNGVSVRPNYTRYPIYPSL